MKTKNAVVVCTSDIKLRAAEALARSCGYGSAHSWVKADHTIYNAIKNGNKSPNGRYLLYLTSGTKGLGWDFDTASYGDRGGGTCLQNALDNGSVRVESIEDLYAFLDNPPSQMPPERIELNSEHVAVVYDDYVQVGCQQFDHKVILKVAKAIERRA